MRRGFTLVEMLVATALVVLIMVLFANVFGEAVTTIRHSRGLMNNDGKARSVFDTLHRDLSHRTYRMSVGRGASVENSQGIVESPKGIVALAPGDRPDPHQLGFLYISENDPLDDGDDVLHLTVSVEESLRDPLASDPVVSLYQGRSMNAGSVGTTFNQPDYDDGVINSAATSRAAEVCYFLRGTTLYRRVLLLRDPLPNVPRFGSQPSDSGVGVLYNAARPYRDFDFALTNIDGLMYFHGLESLDNSLGLANNPLAAPGLRFGFTPAGVPREFDLPGGTFFGRFTHAETSHNGPNGLPPGLNHFRWPGFNDGAGNNIIDSPLIVTPAGGVAVDVAPPNGTFDPGTDVVLQGARAGEDILMTGVETFNIEVWDPGYAEADFDNTGAWDPNTPLDDPNNNGVQDFGIWSDIGNPTGTGLYTQTWTPAPNKLGNPTWGNQNAGYGPGGPTGNRVFDTWHPSLTGSPPFRPLQRASNTNVWTNFVGPGVTAGDVLYPDYNPTSPPDSNYSIGYVALNSGPVGPRAPEWPREPGAFVRDGGVVWQCFDNRIGLERMRITIRFRDPGSNVPRQVTVVHSFVE